MSTLRFAGTAGSYSLAASLLVVSFAVSSTSAAPTAATPDSARQAAAAPKPGVTLKLTSAHRVETGTKSTFTGTAPVKRFKGKRVILQRKVGTGAWVTVGRKKVSAKGTFAFEAVTTGVGVNKWRAYAVIPRTSRSQAQRVQSPVRRVTALQWFYLSELDSVDSGNWSTNSTTMAGRTFTKSVGNGWDWRSGWAEYNLGYKCDSFRADIGIADSSATGTVRRFIASLDGAETTFGDKGLGSVTSVSLDVSSRFRLRLDAVVVTGNDGSGKYGNARILCQAKP